MDKAMKLCLAVIKMALVVGFIFGLICFFSETPEASGLTSQIKLCITGAVICIGCGVALAFIKYKEEA